LPEAKDLQQQAEANNPRLNALRQQIQAAQKRLQAARAERWPVISGTAEANYWDREFGSRDKASAGIEIRVPLYQGGRVSAQISQAQADFQHAQAQLNATQLEVRQAVLDIWMEIKRLEAAKRSVDTYSHWQDLQLDHNRTMYDLEFDTDLGEAMIGQSEARLRKAQNQYALALAWEKLNALIGKEK
jgi:outer membrane protein